MKDLALYMAIFVVISTFIVGALGTQTTGKLSPTSDELHISPYCSVDILEPVSD